MDFTALMEITLIIGLFDDDKIYAGSFLIRELADSYTVKHAGQFEHFLTEDYTANYDAQMKMTIIN